MFEVLLLALELLTIIGCWHRLYQKKIKLTLSLFLLFIYDIFLFYIVNHINEFNMLSLSIYIAIYIYSLHTFKDDLLRTFSVEFLCILITGFLQLLYYMIVTFFIKDIYQDVLIECLVNSLCFVTVMYVGRKVRLYRILEYIRQKDFLTYLCIIMAVFLIGSHILNLQSKEDWSKRRFAEVFILLAFILILWIQYEKNKLESLEKEKQLKKQEEYFKSFENLLEKVRFRQHDMKNHLSAFYGMAEQNEYYHYLAEDTEYKRLAKTDSPVFTGFLNQKSKELEAEKIDFQCHVSCLKLEGVFRIYEWVELAGILIDNAAEAVKDKPVNQRKIYMELIQDREQTVIKVSNVSRYIGSHESAMFFHRDYSTKGEGRGIGLTKLQEMVLRKNGNVTVKNVEKDNENYIEFGICVKNKERV